MPRLAKGGKWVFGWVIVGARGEIAVPPQAWVEYGFCLGDDLLFLRGSRTSGGLAIARGATLPAVLTLRCFARGRIAREGRVSLPAGPECAQGTRLLAVRGSGHALGLLARGPIYELALKHPEVDVCSC